MSICVCRYINSSTVPKACLISSDKEVAKSVGVDTQTCLTPLRISINNYELEVVDILRIYNNYQAVSRQTVRQTNWYGNLYTCPSRNTCVDKSRLSIKTKVTVYNACVLSTLL